MAKLDPQGTCERLFETFLVPLVLGGPMRPGKPIGGKAALAIGEGRPPSNYDLLSQTHLARVRVARHLAPIDHFEQAPAADEWVLAAVLHDLVQSTHPGFDALLRRSGPARLLDIVEKTLDRVPEAATVGIALSRHTWFSRMFELARTDIELKWWTGSQTFLGTEPPGRLTAWPELRRVQETRTPRPLMDLPTSGAAIDVLRFTAAVDAFLVRSPLTDLATMTRASPAFAWSRANLGFCATHAGRTVALRALALLPERGVDAALGRATRALFASRALRALGIAIDVLRDRTLMVATSRISGEREPAPLTIAKDAGDAAFAVSAGALAATHWIATTGGGFSAIERGLILHLLAPAANSPSANEVRALMSG